MSKTRCTVACRVCRTSEQLRSKVPIIQICTLRSNQRISFEFLPSFSATIAQVCTALISYVMPRVSFCAALTSLMASMVSLRWDSSLELERSAGFRYGSLRQQQVILPRHPREWMTVHDYVCTNRFNGSRQDQGADKSIEHFQRVRLQQRILDGVSVRFSLEQVIFLYIFVLFYIFHGRYSCTDSVLLSMSLYKCWDEDDFKLTWILMGKVRRSIRDWSKCFSTSWNRTIKYTSLRVFRLHLRVPVTEECQISPWCKTVVLQEPY